MKRIVFVAFVMFVFSWAMQAQKHRVLLNLVPGSEYTSTSNTSINQDLSFSGQGGKTSQLITMSNRIKVVEKKGNNFVLEGVVELIKASAEGMSIGKIEFSSDDAADTPQNKSLKAMAKKTVRIEVTPEGKLVGDPVCLTEGVDAQTKTTIVQAVLTGMFPYMPSKPIAVGESFKPSMELVETILGSIGAENASLDGKITLVSVTDTDYVFSGKLDFSAQVQGVDLKGPTALNYSIKKNSGLVGSMLSTSRMEGNGTVQGMNLNLTMNNISSYDLSEVQQ